jgi:hypothetical protein
LSVIVLPWSLVLKTEIGASGDCVDLATGWKVGVMLRRLFLLCR